MIEKYIPIIIELYHKGKVKFGVTDDNKDIMIIDGDGYAFADNWDSKFTEHNINVVFKYKDFDTINYRITINSSQYGLIFRDWREKQISKLLDED